MDIWIGVIIVGLFIIVGCAWLYGIAHAKRKPEKHIDEPPDTLIVGPDTFKDVPKTDIPVGWGGIKIIESPFLKTGECVPVNSRRYQYKPLPIVLKDGETLAPRSTDTPDRGGEG